jgi:hypothetical protein
MVGISVKDYLNFRYGGAKGNLNLLQQTYTAKRNSIIKKGVERRKEAVIAQCNATVAAINQLRKFCRSRTMFEASKITLAAAVDQLRARGFEAGCVVEEPDLLHKDMNTVPAPRKSSAQVSSSTMAASTHQEVTNNAVTVSDATRAQALTTASRLSLWISLILRARRSKSTRTTTTRRWRRRTSCRSPRLR